jgi:putative PIN family toxin of toxin-antitoxin system
VRHFEAGAFVPVFSGELVEELRSTLRKPRLVKRVGLHFPPMNRLIAALRASGEELGSPVVVNICRDPADDVFIAVAVDSQAPYLVTRDDDLKGDENVIAYLRNAGTEVLTVREFLALLEEQEGQAATPS